VENLHRENLSPLEEAKAFRSLMELHSFGVSSLAEHLGISKSKVSKTLSLLKLPEEVQEAVSAGDLAPSSAYEISKVESPEEQQEIVVRVKKDRFTQKDTASQVKNRKPSKQTAAPRKLVEKYRSQAGISIEVTIKKKHTAAEVVSALREIADRLERENTPEEGGKEAA
jgi:ParB family chromosome partitioning protein